MKRSFKILLLLLAVLLVAAGVALSSLQSYVQSAPGVARIQAALSKALGMPLEIKHAALGWGGVRLLEVRIVPEGQTVPFLEAPVFSTEYQIMPLLHRQLVLRKMVLEKPHVIWPQNAEGKWVLPTRQKGPKVAAPSAPREHAEKDFELALDTLEIRDGTLELLDAKSARFASMEGVQISASLANTDAVSAVVSATSLALLQGGPVFDKVLLPFQYAGGKLSFPQCEGALGGGTVKGSFSMAPKAADAPFDLQLTLEKVDLARSIADPEWQIRSGQLQASLTLHGTSNEKERRTGRGEIHLTQASVDSLEPLLRLIGETCHVPELANLKLSLQNNLATFAQTLGFPEVISLREASTVFELRNKETVVQNLLVDGGDLAVGVKGTISEDGKLNLDANLNVAENLMQKLPGFVKKSLTTTESNGRKGIAFNITGKNDHPKTNLVDKVLGQQVPSQFNDLVKSILGSSKKDDDKKKDKKDKDKSMSDAEKKEKKDKKAKDKEQMKDQEGELAKGASPDANPIPSNPAPPPLAVPPPSAPAPEAPAPPPAPVVPGTPN